MMKYFKNLLVLVVLLFPVGVFASGGINVSPTTLEIEVGSKKSFKISAYNSIGDVILTTSNSSVATISTSSWGTGMVDEKQTKSTNITVTGKRIGDATITLSIDAATFDGEDLSNQKRIIKVKVVEKKQTPNDNKKITKSTNNKLKSISIGEYEIVKVNSNYYEASVGKDVDKINVKVVAEDSKSKITGAGTKKLNLGENNFVIVITSESGAQNKINFKVIKEQNDILDDNNNLSNIEINGYELSFNREKLNYNLKIKNEEKLDINAIAESEKALVTINGNENLKNESKIIVNVKSESGELKKYTINIQKDDNESLVEEKNDKAKDLIIYIESGVLGIALISIIIVALKKKKS